MTNNRNMVIKLADTAHIILNCKNFRRWGAMELKISSDTCTWGFLACSSVKISHRNLYNRILKLSYVEALACDSCEDIRDAFNHYNKRKIRK
jgi:hypothetical protein